MTKTTKKPVKNTSKSSSAKSKATKSIVNKHNLASTAMVLALINALFAVLFVAMLSVIYLTLPGGNSTVAEVIGWILLAFNIVISPFIAVAAIIMALVSVNHKTNRMQAATAIIIVLLSFLMFGATWAMSIS